MGLFHEITEALSGHGHDCTCDDCMEEHHDHEHHHGFDGVMVWRLIVSAVLFVAGLVTEKTLPALSTILNILAILVAGYDVFIRAIANIFRKKLSFS